MGTIFGVLSYHAGDPTREASETLAASLRHRKFDYLLTYRSTNCVIGEMGRGVSDGDLLDPVYRVAVAMDGRFDNRDEAISCLGLPPSSSSRRIVAAAYRKWGKFCANHLLGDFAFAVLELDTGSLFLTRDHFGVRPLNYAAHNDRFAFASEGRALVVSKLASKEPDKTRLTEYLLGAVPSSDRTFFKDVKILPAAHSLHCAEPQNITTHQYWSVPWQESEHSSNESDIINGLRDLLQEAVRCRIENEALVGSFLSGGLDSSSITMLAQAIISRTQSQPNMPVFSAVFPNAPITNEEEWIDLVVGATLEGAVPLNPQKLSADTICPIDYIDHFASLLGGPTSLVNLYYTWELYRKAGSLGVTTLLSGIDGDSVISHGTNHATHLSLKGDWDSLASFIDDLSDDLYQGFSERQQRRAMAASYVQPAIGFHLRDWRPFAAARVFMNARRRYGLSGRDMVMNEVLPNLGGWFEKSAISRKDTSRSCLSKKFLDLDEVSEILARDVALKSRSENDHHYKAVSSSRIASAFEAMDLLGSHVGVSSVHPFFDKRVVEFALRIPLRLKVRDGRTRFILREAMKGIVPRQILERRNKAHMGAALARNILTGLARADWSENLFQDGRLTDWDFASLREAEAKLVKGSNIRSAEQLMYFWSHAAHLRDVEGL